jgi:hypothetical protein
MLSRRSRYSTKLELTQMLELQGAAMQPLLKSCHWIVEHFPLGPCNQKQTAIQFWI